MKADVHKKKRIVITGGNSRFCIFLKKNFKKHMIYYPTKKKFNILNLNQMEKFIKKKRINYLIHIAGLSRPMSFHEQNINLSINLNIIGTANIVKLCNNHKIKLIYFSTHYVYPCKKGNFKETDPLLPINNYAWSKLGGEASVQMYKNSLILRLSMTEYPFIHQQVVDGARSSFIFNKTVAKIIPFLLDEKGILNIGGKTRNIYNFVKRFSKSKILKINAKKIKNFPKDSSLNVNRLQNIIAKQRIKGIVL
jgi:dTDP-4-dehydrorhamnose reductase